MDGFDLIWFDMKNLFKHGNFIKVEYTKIQSNVVYLKAVQYISNKETKSLSFILVTNLTITKIQF